MIEARACRTSRDDLIWVFWDGACLTLDGDHLTAAININDVASHMDS